MCAQLISMRVHHLNDLSRDHSSTMFAKCEYECKRETLNDERVDFRQVTHQV